MRIFGYDIRILAVVVGFIGAISFCVLCLIGTIDEDWAVLAVSLCLCFTFSLIWTTRK